MAETLNRLGVRPSRGTGRLTARSVRGWCERVATDVAGKSIAAINARSMLTDKWQNLLAAQEPQAARHFVLDALRQAVTKTT